IGREPISQLIGRALAVMSRREAASVEARRRIDIPGDELQPQVARRVPAELRVESRVLRAVLVAQNGIGRLRVEAVGLEPGRRDEVVSRVAAAGKARVELTCREIAVLDTDPPSEIALACMRHDIDDAARVGAVHKALRPSQHLYALDVAGCQQAVETGLDVRSCRIDGLDAVNIENRAIRLLAANPQRRRLAGPSAVADA